MSTFTTLEVLTELLQDLYDKPDAPLNYIKAVENSIEVFKTQAIDLDLTRFVNQYQPLYQITFLTDTEVTHNFTSLIDLKQFVEGYASMREQYITVTGTYDYSAFYTELCDGVHIFSQSTVKKILAMYK
jgi:hypothetical protein